MQKGYSITRETLFAKICILIENTPRSMTMPDGTGTFEVWARNRFLTYDS